MVSLRVFFTRNIGMKIISIMLAVALWMYVVGEETAEIGITIPLELVNLPQDLIVVNDAIEDLNVRILGPRSMIRRLASERLSKTIDLKGIAPGRITFEILPEELPLPGGIKVTRLSPSSITLDVEQITSKKLSVLPILQGSPKLGFEVVSVKFTPESVVVSGPSNVLSNMDAVWTKPINVEKKTESFRQPVTLDIGGDQVALELKEQVSVDVTIDEKVVTRSFPAVPIKGRNSSFSYSFTPTEITVQLIGPIMTLDKIEKEKSVEAYVELMGLMPGDYERRVLVNAPKGVTVFEISPSMVGVHIRSPQKGEN